MVALSLLQMFQLLSAIAHVHQAGVFHRDIKPENLLLQLDNFIPPASTSAAPASSRPSSRPNTSSAAYLAPSVKLADFGQARDIRSRPPYTEYVSTRWYRAPEQLLHSTSYNSPIDVWAAGCIMAELHTLTPLFAGHNEADTLQRIVQIVSPSATWLESQQMLQHAMLVTAGVSKGATATGSTAREGLKRSVGGASEPALDLMAAMLQWDPKSRTSARDALLHPYFDGFERRTGGQEERKEEAKDDSYGWDEGATYDSDEDAVVQVSADGGWLTASNRFGELRCRYFPLEVHRTVPLGDKQRHHSYKSVEEPRGERSSSASQLSEVADAPSIAKSGIITIASKLDWPSFSEDSDDEDTLAAPARSTSNSRSFNSTTSDPIRHLSSARSAAITEAASDTPSVRPSAAAFSVPTLPFDSPTARPPSVLSTHRTRRSFAMVGSQMFTDT